jgi:hypothetical protein
MPEVRPALWLYLKIGGQQMKWYNAIVYAFGIAFCTALALFPKTAPAQEVLSGRGIICDTAGLLGLSCRGVRDALRQARHLAGPALR